MQYSNIPPNMPLPVSSLNGAADRALFLDLLPWLLALVALVIVGGICIYAAKRLLRSGSDAVPEGFTLQSLRDLHAAGELSDEEFARAREAMIGKVQRSAALEDESKLAESSDVLPSDDGKSDKNPGESGGDRDAEDSSRK